MLNPPLPENPEGDDRVRYWVIVQLSGLARSKLSNLHIQTVISKHLKQEPLFVYIPIIEDYYGKQDSGYGEYVFINYNPETDYYLLEDLEEFTRVLKHPHTKKPQLLSDDEIEAIKNHIIQEIRIYKDDVVRITRGNLRGNYGVVNFVSGDMVSVRIQMGQESLESTLPLASVRRSKRRTLVRKKDLDDRFTDQVIPGKKSPPVFGSRAEVKIIKRSAKYTKILIQGKIHSVPNEQVESLLLKLNRRTDEGDHGSTTSL